MTQIELGLKILNDFDWDGELATPAMKDAGFKVVKSSGIAFIGEEHVIKNAYFLGDQPRKSITTDWIRPCDYDPMLEWVMQPRAKPISAKVFVDLWENHANTIYEDYGTDLEDRSNLGEYKGEIVAIDW